MRNINYLLITLFTQLFQHLGCDYHDNGLGRMGGSCVNQSVDLRRELHRVTRATRNSALGSLVRFRKLRQERIRSIFVLVLR